MSAEEKEKGLPSLPTPSRSVLRPQAVPYFSPRQERERIMRVHAKIAPREECRVSTREAIFTRARVVPDDFTVPKKNKGMLVVYSV